MTELHELGAADAAQAIAAGRITSERLVRACLDRIAEGEPALGAFAHLDPMAAIRAAQEADRGPARGPLHGVPVGIKDIMDTADQPTAYGSPIYAGHRPAWDAACVALLRRAGAIILGKTVTTEFAYFTPGKTRNPHNPAHTPGGSSSGSAAAVAALMVPLATGTQTAGSIVRPGSFCGVFACKPSFGHVATAGVKPFSWSLDTMGGFARSAVDLALLLEAMTGRALRAAMPLARPPAIGLCRSHDWAAASAPMQAALERAGARAASAGARVREIALPKDFGALQAAHKAIMAYEAAHAYASELFHHRERLSERLRDLLEEGARVAPAQYDDARSRARAARQRVAEAFGEVDVLLTPSAPGEAPAGIEATGDPVFNRVWTLLGLPCVNVPAGTGPNGLPLGLTVVGRYGEDAYALAAAGWLAAKIA